MPCIQDGVKYLAKGLVMKRIPAAMAAVFSVLLLSPVMAAGTPISTPVHNIKEYNLPADKLAIQGYDPVSYFSGAPTAGDSKITAVVDGVTYRFVNEDHKKTFAADPYKYAPAYGGWCATAMAEGKKVEIDPKNFRISGGRLFLFYKSLLSNARNDWDKDEKNMMARADAAWKKISGE
jgi:YHS domain-containing protein